MNAKITLAALVLAFVSFSMSSCKKSEIEDALDPSSQRPDLHLTLQVTGAVTLSSTEVYPENAGGDFSTACNYVPSENHALTLGMGLVEGYYVITESYDAQSLIGTRPVASSAFYNSTTMPYEGTSGTVTITSAQLYAEEVAPDGTTLGHYSMAGSYSLTMEQVGTGAVVNVEGNFSGLYGLSVD